MMKSVAIIGGGITGLTAAFRLAEQNIPCDVYEAGSRTGGVIGSYRENGYLAEAGPNAITETSQNISALINDAGLVRKRIYSNPNASGNFLLHNGKLIAAPTSLLKFFTTSLFSARGKIRVCMEPFIRADRSNEDESLSEFVCRRLGPEFLDAVINPLVAGIYAGDPDLLSVRSGFPKLHSAELLYGSLFRAQIFGAGARRRSGEIPKTEAKKFSFIDGLQTLPAKLTEKLGEAVHLDTPVKAIRPEDGEWSVHFPSPLGITSRRHSAVLLAVPGHRLPDIAFNSPPNAGGGLAPFGEIIHPPVASVVLGFRREDVRHHLAGFGFLVPASEKRRILGAIFSSSIFSGRAPAGHVALTIYIGGCRNPDLALQSPNKVIADAVADIRDILGVTGSPTFEHCTVVPRAIPQYNIGYERFKQTMDRLETANPGLFFAGTSRDGIALGQSLIAGHEISRSIRAHVTRQSSLSAAAA